MTGTGQREKGTVAGKGEWEWREILREIWEDK
jgi:hypothetical protein